MPARAFLLFGPASTRACPCSSPNSFNAREGIFAFRTFHYGRAYGAYVRAGFNAREGIFAFRTSGAHPHVSAPVEVSMPARAFLLFGLVFSRRCLRATTGFNAREGIFAFRTRKRNETNRHPQRDGFQCPRGHFCFSDTFQPLRGARASAMFQCPRGHFCFSDPP